MDSVDEKAVLPTAISPVRPALSFESITFSNRDKLHFESDDIIVLVGPNNAGKSAALRELEQFIIKSTPGDVITEVVFRKSGTQEEFLAYLESNSTRSKDVHGTTYSGFGYGIHNSHVTFFDSPHGDRHPVASFFYSKLSTESRIGSSNPAGPIKLYQEPPSHPIHLLMMDDKLETRISELFKRAFGKDLIAFKAGGSQFPLYVGEKPPLAPGENELSRTFVEKVLANSAPLDSQGDGMRSFASVVLYTLVAEHHSIQFLDEPEAFLHPPQARLLGEYIAKERKNSAQLFIATHSTDILDGLIAGGAEKIRIVRIQRDGKINRVKELSPSKAAGIVHDTLTRYSGVFEGIFYQHVVIGEADSDCMFYSSVLNSGAVSKDRKPDVLFIHAAGKHRMVQLADTLRELDVPISVIADVDLLREEQTFKSLYERLGGEWSDVQPHFNAIKTSVEGRRPPLTAEQVRRMIEEKLASVTGIEPFPKQVEREIGRIFKSLSPWDEVKRAGRPGFPQGQTTRHFDELSRKCQGVGLWIVPVGELEGFCRSIDAGHGPNFVAKVLEERDIETDPELHEAREFVRAIWARARPSA